MGAVGAKAWSGEVRSALGEQAFILMMLEEKETRREDEA